MPIERIAIIGAGDMGHKVGRALTGAGIDVVTCLAGRGARTRGLAEAAGMRDLPDLAALVDAADLVLSIVPPAVAADVGDGIAAALGRTGARPPFADCNAVAPRTVQAIAAAITVTGAPFIDAGIVGLGPGGAAPTRFYVSGPDTTAMDVLDGKGMRVKHLGPEVGRASALKMCYAGLNKGRFSLYTAVMVAAETLGLGAELREELEFSQPDTLAAIERLLPRLPADAERWAPEMDEIAATFASVGVTPGFHRGAGDILRLLATTPFATETRETIDPDRGLVESVRVYAAHLPKTKA